MFDCAKKRSPKVDFFFTPFIFKPFNSRDSPSPDALPGLLRFLLLLFPILIGLFFLLIVSDGESPSESHDNEADQDDVWVLQAQPKSNNNSNITTSKMRNNTQLQQPMQTLQPSNPLGKRHALKIYY